MSPPSFIGRKSAIFRSVWGENVCSGARYNCGCNVLRDRGIRFIPT